MAKSVDNITAIVGRLILTVTFQPLLGEIDAQCKCMCTIRPRSGYKLSVESVPQESNAT